MPGEGNIEKYAMESKLESVPLWLHFVLGMGNNLIYLHGLTIMMITQNMIEVEG